MRLARYALAGIAIGAVAALTAPALGLFRADPHQPALVSDEVHQLVSLKTQDGKTASLWSAPTTDGGVCTLFHLAPASSAATPPGLGNSGSDCTIGPSRAPQPAPFQTSLNWLASDTGSGFRLIFYGHVSAASRISRVELSSGAGTFELPFAKGYFLGELPSVASAGDLPMKDAPYVLHGYGSDGRLLASLDLAHVVAMSSPPQR
jgi:hypothetical protein